LPQRGLHLSYTLFECECGHWRFLPITRQVSPFPILSAPDDQYNVFPGNGQNRTE